MKTKYKINKNNQLVVINGKVALEPRGLFRVDSNNRLIYRIIEPASWRQDNDLPREIVLEGKWTIDKQHKLIFRLKTTDTQAGNQVIALKTELTAALAKALVFSLATRPDSGSQAIRLLQLKGRWQADKHNRLQFLVKRLKADDDAITFQGAWQVKNNSLVYSYRSIQLKTKKKLIRTLRFQGYWQISARDRIVYILDSEDASAFSFKAYLQTPSLIEKKGLIKYRVGIGVKGSSFFKTETVTLYGVWKLERKTGLSLELDYGRGKIKAINFVAFIRLADKDKIILDLKTAQGKKLGISVLFRKKFLKNKAEWFFKITKERKHPRFDWGFRLPW